MNVFYIHGAHSTPATFNSIKKTLPKHNITDISYSCDVPLNNTINELIERINTDNKEINIISHSLGGIIAVSLAQKLQLIRKIITIGTPFGGSKGASIMRWMIRNQLLSDLDPHNSIFHNLKHLPINAEVMSIVTTEGGSPMMKDQNDGVVTVASQTDLIGPTYVTVPYNHFEALMVNDTFDIINKFMFDK